MTNSRCIRFTEQEVGTVYTTADEQFTDTGATIGVGPLQLPTGTPATNGSVTVERGQQAGGSGNELHLVNMRISLLFQYPLEELTLRLRQNGTVLVMQVNGTAYTSTQGFRELNNQVVGGCARLFVSGPDAQGRERLRFEANVDVYQDITAFVIGGEELWIDDICLRRA